MTTPAVSSLLETAHEWQRAIASRNADSIASFFAEDALAMYPFPSATIGRAANREAWARYYDHNAIHPVCTDSVVVSASGEMGYTLGRFANAEVAGSSAEAGRYVAIWRQHNGKWEIVILSAHVHPDIQPFPFRID
jgi:ketosteroid isomerase-like protein